MKIKLTSSVLGSLVMAATLSAQTPAPSTPQAPAPSPAAPVESGLEVPGEVDAAAFLPADILSGVQHRVEPTAYNDGLINTYFLTVGYQQYQVSGTVELINRVREIYAMSYLKSQSKSEEFGRALQSAVGGKLKSAGKLIEDPVGTIKRVPQGASRFFGRVSEGLKGGKSRTEDGALASLTGVTKAKNKLAADLGVSPYTTNEDLQQELNAMARATAAGGFTINLGTAAVGGGLGGALSVVNVNQTLQTALVTSTPEELRMQNRTKLLGLGVSPELTEEFLMHPWYSPWLETITVAALSEVGVNATAFIRDAMQALTPQDALFFQRTAQILARYHATAAPLRELRQEGGRTVGVDKDGKLVFPVAFDFAIWGERAARRADEFTALQKARPEIKGLALWTDGRISRRLGEELTRRGIGYRELALDAKPQ